MPTLSEFRVPATNGYDGLGNRLSVTSTVNGGAPASYSGTTSYAYDCGQTANPQLNRSQVTQEVSTRNSGYTNVFGYDSNTSTGPGNPTSFKGAAHTFNTNNQQTDSGIGYDGAGNPTTYHSQAVTYDPENRMTAYGSVQTDGYDGDGLRAWKVVSGVSTYFLYDGDQIVGIYGVSGSAAVFEGTNTWGAGGLVSRRYQGVTDFYVFDERGNVSQRTSSTGSVTMTETYDAYGARTGTGSQPDPWGYMGQVGYYNDGDKSLLLCTHRFYDPATGRFVTRDPIDYYGGINLYGYVRNDPVNEDDTSGCGPPFYPIHPGPVRNPVPVPPCPPPAPTQLSCANQFNSCTSNAQNTFASAMAAVATIVTVGVNLCNKWDWVSPRAGAYCLAAVGAVALIMIYTAHVTYQNQMAACYSQYSNCLKQVQSSSGH